MLARRRVLAVRALTRGMARLALATAPESLALIAASSWTASLHSRGAALGGVVVLAAPGVAVYLALAHLLDVPVLVGSSDPSLYARRSVGGELATPRSSRSAEDAPE